MVFLITFKWVYLIPFLTSLLIAYLIIISVKNFKGTKEIESTREVRNPKIPPRPNRVRSVTPPPPPVRKAYDELPYQIENNPNLPFFRSPPPPPVDKRTPEVLQTMSINFDLANELYSSESIELILATDKSLIEKENFFIEFFTPQNEKKYLPVVCSFILPNSAIVAMRETMKVSDFTFHRTMTEYYKNNDKVFSFTSVNNTFKEGEEIIVQNRLIPWQFKRGYVKRLENVSRSYVNLYVHFYKTSL